MKYDPSMFEKLDESEKNDEAIAMESKTFLQDTWRRFCSNKLAILGLVVLVIMILLAVFVPVFSQYTYDGQDLANTNALLAMNLQSTDGTPTIWDALKEFRSTYGDRWFIPSLEESSLYIGYVYWTSSEVTSQSAYTRNTSVTADSANKTSKNNVYAFTYV